MQHSSAHPCASVVLLAGNPRIGLAVLLDCSLHPGWLIVGFNELEGQADEVEWKGKREADPVEEEETKAVAAYPAGQGLHG